jgi:hypothetical protein
MVSRRDALGYLGLSAAARLMPGAPGYAERGASDRSTSRPGPANPSRPATSTMIPFTLNGRAGTVAMTYGITEDPILSGFDVVPAFNGDIAVCRGYPTIQGVIARYDGAGYRARCGWLQVVTGNYYRAGDPVEAPADTARSVDRYPALMDIDVPFASYGTLPAFFDAPCRNLGGYVQLRWTADTFLATLPLRSKTEAIHRLLGVRWGYAEYADPGRHPVSPFPLVVTGPDSWNGLLPFLGHSFPRWRFAPDT